jgi:thiamine-monophosphate kinase
MNSEDQAVAAMLAELRIRGDVRVGIGDDAAVVGPDPGTLIAHDMVVEDVHFRWTTHSPGDVGHLCLAVNLSDIAAMGGRPSAAVVGIAGPLERLGEAHIREVYRAMDALAETAGCAIVGGDLSRAPVTMIGVTVIGTMPDGLAAVTRSGARVGDAVCVTGPLGRSAAGRALLDDPPPRLPAGFSVLIDAHRRPTPRIDTGQRLAVAGASAMMDISDGLIIDAERLAVASDCRIVVDLDTVPVEPAVAAVARDRGTRPDLFAATGGEDYELLVALRPELLADLGDLVIQVGEVVGGPAGVTTVRGDVPVTVDDHGWDHFRVPRN